MQNVLVPKARGKRTNVEHWLGVRWLGSMDLSGQLHAWFFCRSVHWMGTIINIIIDRCTFHWWGGGDINMICPLLLMQISWLLQFLWSVNFGGKVFPPEITCVHPPIWWLDYFAGNCTHVHKIKSCEVYQLSYFDSFLIQNEMYWVPT
jgi:hypothetical protein